MEKFALHRGPLKKVTTRDAIYLQYDHIKNVKSKQIVLNNWYYQNFLKCFFWPPYVFFPNIVCVENIAFTSCATAVEQMGYCFVKLNLKIELTNLFTLSNNMKWTEMEK